MCGLSRKQKWRRQHCIWSPYSSMVSKSEDEKEKSLCSSASAIARNETSETEDSSQYGDDLGYEVEKCDGNPPSHEDSQKRVQFCNTVRVILIPSIQEYKDAHLMGRLWWTASEIQQFEFNMIGAVRDFMYEHCCTDYKAALLQMTLECDEENESQENQQDESQHDKHRHQQHPPAPVASPPALPKSVRSTLEQSPIKCCKKKA